MSDETEFLSLITDVESNSVAIREFFPYPEPRCSDERFANYDRIVSLSKRNTVGIDPHTLAKSLTWNNP